MATALLADLLDELDYASSEGLVSTDSYDVSATRIPVWQEARRKFAIDAAFFMDSVPVVFFKDASDGTDLAEMHLRLWNYNQIPLLIGVSPGRVVVYNCFAPPTRGFTTSMAMYFRILPQKSSG